MNIFLVLKWQGNLILSEKIGSIMFCECYGSNFIITMPPRTQYLPVARISKTDGERTAREARMSASVY